MGAGEMMVRILGSFASTVVFSILIGISSGRIYPI
jgi:hypothetical protein